MIQKKKFSEAIAANISVVEGLLNISIKATEDSAGITDINDFKKDYGYAIFRNVAHKPTNISAFGVLSIRITNAGWFSQIGFCNREIFYRTYKKDNNIWTDWIKLTTTAYGTQE